MTEKNIGASVRTKLFNLAKAQNIEFLPLLIRYATDRFLYRLSKSKVRNNFVLKGSILFSVWAKEQYRTTRDADLLGYGNSDEKYLRKLFTEICLIDATEDGLIFDTNSLFVEAIRDQQEYGGNRVKVKASLNNAVVTVQIDIGYGDVVTPGTEEICLPALLNMPSAKLLAYSQETVIAEKTEAMVKLSIANSRMKDFYDINWLADNHNFDGGLLSNAIAATFKRRQTEIPEETPFVLTVDFYHDQNKIRQWQAFVGKLKPPVDMPFTKLGARMMQFLIPPLVGAKKRDFSKRWTPDKGWH